ncbi:MULTISPECIES: AzlC family ABC transporter permease [Uliginosibacterium]|uniref:AzlC family ABC transporter permease n=1 Tax=Uliginosibacterium aquaticum TaxID=2731212 RepID=A0ABX2IP82_9RHOO|nr:MULTISPECIES: AzlC family ABC transporter permease [Uliginosibacterium]MDO6387173.1 AzlC family ABC transporter permease [Uliginosibacterium sp. 31-12]NSL56063.1 AzlC family ABC transporter permease [Uliginosibacterium aquaticum]PLK50809.1 branched-chain amino acid ABC transporter permease [Uliginosibacterium sp. TH139]
MGNWDHLVGASWRGECWAGARAELPLLLGVLPFGLVYGVLGLQAGLPGWAVVLMSSIVFGGSSQVVFAQLWGAGVPAPVIVGTVGVVNLRHALYSASVAQLLAELPLRWKLLLAYLLTDEAYMAAVGRLTSGPRSAVRHWFLFGTGFTLWAGWQLSTLGGVLLGATIPAGWALDFSIALTFIALLVPSLRRRSECVAAAVAGAVALLAQGVPYKLWILLAALAGMLAGMLAQALQRGKSHE